MRRIPVLLFVLFCFSEILAAAGLTSLRIVPASIKPGGSFSVFVPGGANMSLDIQWQLDGGDIQQIEIGPSFPKEASKPLPLQCAPNSASNETAVARDIDPGVKWHFHGARV